MAEIDDDPFDPDRIALNPAEVAAVQDAVSAIRRRRGRSRPKSVRAKRLGSFVPAVSLQEFCRWQKLGSDCLALMLLLRRQYALDKDLDSAVIIGEQVLEAMGMSTWRRDRALTKLMDADEIHVVKHRGRSPRITLAVMSIEVPDQEAPR